MRYKKQVTLVTVILLFLIVVTKIVGILDFVISVITNKYFIIGSFVVVLLLLCYIERVFNDEEW